MTSIMHQLPRFLDQIAGLRVGRWLRESTMGQWDNWGPDAQRELQERVIARYGLVDTGLVWQGAASGRTVYQGPEFAAMTAAAKAGRYRCAAGRIRLPVPAEPQADSYCR